MKGTVKFFNDSKGFGFIAGEDGSDYFVHVTGIMDGIRIADNDNVEFDVEQGNRGPKAVRVKMAGASSEEAAPEESEEVDSDDDSE